MSLPTAQPAEILRAWQKDELYVNQLASLLSRLLPSKWATKTGKASSLLYKGLTTLNDLQTLGEEYSGIVQVDETYTKLPLYKNRLMSILLSTFGETITRKLIRHAVNKVEKNSTIRPEVQNTILIALQMFYKIVPQIETVYRALCYISGGPIQIGKFVSGIDYVQARPAAAAHYAHLRLLGLVMLLHSFITFVQSLLQAKNHMDQMRELQVEVDNSKLCVACLEEMAQPCVLQCGHIFCMDCCYGALDFCALCRTPFPKNCVVPLINYHPLSLGIV